MENKKQNKPSFEERQIKERNKTMNGLRTMQGIKQLFSSKLKLITFLLFIASTIIIWFLYIYKGCEDISRLLFYIIYWLVFGLLVFGILMWFGKPRNARKIEDGIRGVFNIQKAYKVPILASITTNRENKVKTYKFYSPDFSKHKYEEEKINLEQKLGIKILGEVRSNGKYVLFDGIANKKIRQDKELEDDGI